MQAALAETQEAMRIQRRLKPAQDDNFAMQTAEGALEGEEDLAILMTALPMLVSVSLVVGGIVIMNIMLMAVAERTVEIGIRRRWEPSGATSWPSSWSNRPLLPRRGDRDRHRDRPGLRGALAHPAARGGRALVGAARRVPGRGGGHDRGDLPRQPRLHRSHHRAPGRMKKLLNSGARILEGMGMALDSVRANKVRAADHLGVAIGVMVVIAMASAITGINRAVSAQLETLGPKTFFVFRFFQGGLNISDGSDEMSPWRRNPWLTTDEAALLRTLPTVRDVGYKESTGAPMGYGDFKLSSVQLIGYTTNWPEVSGGTITAGRNWTDIEFAAGANVTVINDKLGQTMFPGWTRSEADQDLRAALPGRGGLRRSLQSLRRRLQLPGHDSPHLHQGGRLVQGLARLRGPSHRSRDGRGRSGRRDRRPGPRPRPSQENNFAVVTQDKLMETFNSVTSGFFLVMLALSSVGLMVGGVGVVAIMMISVTERTREIGVLALGHPAKILFQFLVEAASLTMIGGRSGSRWAPSSPGPSRPSPRCPPRCRSGRWSRPWRVGHHRHLLRHVPGHQGEPAGSGRALRYE